MLEFATSVRDPIHGAIPLTAYERDLLRTRPLARLRGVRQMGMAYLVYSGAHHTRYEHVIGAMHTSWLLCQGLTNLSDDDKRLIRLAALTHDLGHRPFSHSLEDAARRFANQPQLELLHQFHDHETHTRDLLLHDAEIGAVLARYPETARIDRAELAALATGEHPRPELNLLIHSEIDADRIDYVLRDNYYCGFAHGVDTESLADLYVPDPTYGLVLNARRTYIAVQLLSARFHLISNIQNNAMVRLGDLVLAQCIEAALANAPAAVKADFVEAANHGTDADMEQFLRQHAGEAWHQLQALVGGNVPFQEAVLYDFPVLSPSTRYALHSLQQHGTSVGLPIQQAIRQLIPAPPLLVDLRRISPPVDPLRTSKVGHLPWHGRLTDLPTVKGLVQASLEALALRVYTPPPGPPRQLDPATFAQIAANYRILDPSLDLAKAEGIAESLWEGDRWTYGLLLALESTAFDQLQERLRQGPSRLDRLFLSCYAALSYLEETLLDPRVYLDGPEAIVGLLCHPRLAEVFGDTGPVFPEDELSGPWRNDLLFLGSSGLLAVLVRVERVRSAFVPRAKYGTTGWGRRLFQLLTAGKGDLPERLSQAAQDILEPHLDTYRAYFGLLGAAAESSQRRDLRREMPVPISR